ncbi:hypothetical protein BDM02DRAFT_1359434 [Thelephora ganbajun]|uniref:Uncharacterized protein n=1 Tax=Thelephora ganbajun TaxID=370292 RepID=A0ACB6Z2H9_THEGA|nr:hypothetical protein BDM02DRAFT_1359434 [Thelephora ganbajun]
MDILPSAISRTSHLLVRQPRQSTMERSQPFPGSFHVTNNRRVAGGGAIPTNRYVAFPPHDADPQPSTCCRLLPSYRPGPSPSPVASSSYMDSRRMENGDMTLPIHSPSPVTPPRLRGLLTKLQSRGDWPHHREGPLNGVPPRPHVVPGPNQGLAGSTGESPVRKSIAFIPVLSTELLSTLVCSNISTPTADGRLLEARGLPLYRTVAGTDP